MSRVSKDLLDKRRKMFDDFSSFRNRAVRRFNELYDSRLKLRNGQDTEPASDDEEDEDDEDFIEYTVQFLVESKKEEVAPLE